MSRQTDKATLPQLRAVDCEAGSQMQREQVDANKAPMSGSYRHMKETQSRTGSVDYSERIL